MIFVDGRLRLLYMSEFLSSTLSLCSAKKCTLEELAVLNAIENNPKTTQTDIAKAINKSASTIKRITSLLVDRGVLVRKNGRCNGWWEISTK